MTRLRKGDPRGTALIAVLLLQPVAGSLCAAVCGRDLSGAGQEEHEAAPSHCGGGEKESDSDRRPCDGHTRVHSSAAAPRKAPLSGGREIASALQSPSSAETPGIGERLVRTQPVSHPSHAPPGRAVLRL